MKVNKRDLKKELIFLCETLTSIQKEGLHITQGDYSRYTSKFLKDVEVELFSRKIDNLARHLVSFRRFVEMLEDEN